MCYFGGRIGHLKNAPPLQAPGFDLGPIDPSSKEMAVEDDDDDPCSSTNDNLGHCETRRVVKSNLKGCKVIKLMKSVVFRDHGIYHF